MARPEGRADRAGEPGGAGILPRRLAGSNPALRTRDRAGREVL